MTSVWFAAETIVPAIEALVRLATLTLEADELVAVAWDGCSTGVFFQVFLVFSGHGPEALTNTVALQLARAGCEENVVNFILKANRCATASSDGSVSCKSNVIKYIHKANKPAL